MSSKRQRKIHRFCVISHTIFVLFLYYFHGLVVSVFASHTVGHEFASRPGHTKDHHKNGTNYLPVQTGTQCVRVRV